jgi:hypothetical protein
MNVPSSTTPLEMRPPSANPDEAETLPSSGSLRLFPPGGWSCFFGGRRREPSAREQRPRPGHAPALARPRRMTRCARSIVLWTLGLYALAVVAENIAMYVWFPGPFERLYREKWDQLRRLAAEPGRPLVVMLGSSRTDGAFQAGRLNGMPGPDGRPLGAYNLGIPAAGPLHEYQYVRDMLAEGIRPRLLLVEVLPPLFNEPHNHLISEEDWPVADWMSLHQFCLMHSYFARPCRKANEWLAARLGPWYTRRISLHSWLPLMLYGRENLRPFPYPHDDWGCRCPEELTPRQRFDCIVAARDYIPSLNHFRLGGGPVRALHDLLALCRDEGIPAALLLTPESSTFRSWYQPDCLKTMRRLLEEMRAAYGVEVIDATCWLDDDDFMDGHHLDNSGAAKFTARMSEEVQRLLR